MDILCPLNDMEKVFNKFKELIEKRCDYYPLLNFGEDSIRYDFFFALSSVLFLEPWQIQLEYAINPKAYVARNNTKAKRKEKPMIDLILKDKSTDMCAEFALFRQNSNDDGSINKTARTVKMLNDMIRVGLEAYFSERIGYFVCIADQKMLGHRLRSKILGNFPSDYLITEKVIKAQQQSKTCKFDSRFIAKFFELKAKVKSTVIFEENVIAQKIHIPTKILIWQIELTVSV